MPKLQPIDGELFFFVFQLASKAMSGQVPQDAMPSMVGRTMTLEVEPGQPQAITFTAHPVVRLMDAVASQMTEPLERISTAARIYHLYSVLEDVGAQSFLREVDGEPQVHPSLVLAASMYPADTDKGFDDGFFVEAATIREEMESLVSP